MADERLWRLFYGEGGGFRHLYDPGLVSVRDKTLKKYKPSSGSLFI